VSSARGILREIGQAPLYGALGYRLNIGAVDGGARLPRVDGEGQVCLVTGASQGIGLAVARGMAELGATVVLVCRDAGRGAAAARAIRAAAGHERVHVERCDLSSPAAVRDLAVRTEDRFPRLDVLVNNVAATFARRERTPEGLERTFATNVLGGYLLTRLLLPRLLAAAPARILFVGSAAQYLHRLDVDALVSPPWPYAGELVYGRSKRAVAALSRIFGERLAGTGVSSNCAHPGLVATPGVVEGYPRYHSVARRLLRRPEEGADTIVWLARSPAGASSHAGVWFDRELHPEHVFSRTAAGPDDLERLWTRCAELSGMPAY
jgi:NAD(P)-dependent dehydrogenase (short-subunit alcohol dehydrogenase family)